MKRIFGTILLIAGITVAVASCKKEPKQQPIEVAVQLVCEGLPFETEGVTVTLTDPSGIGYESVTDAAGLAVFKVLAGPYTASAVYKQVIDGERIAYNGTNTNVIVDKTVVEAYPLVLNKVVSQQIIIKEFYHSGCRTNDDQKTYASDQYVILYNNSPDPADASNIVFAHGMPYMASSGNAYYGEDGKLLYENLDWMPAGSALWWFTNPVTIEPYSQIVVVFSAAIDHTAEVEKSVDLSKSEYYWMSNIDVPEYSANKSFKVSENIPTTHYLTAKPFADTRGSWSLGTDSPVFYIGKMPSTQANEICSSLDYIDMTLGQFKGMYTLKFPKSCFVDGLEIWVSGNEDKSMHRMAADVNTGHLTMNKGLGYTAYRNVDKEATEALPENEGKLVYGYTGGTGSAEEDNLSTDPSGIDAEASIANGAHIIYSETNNTALDFHQRSVSSLKK